MHDQQDDYIPGGGQCTDGNFISIFSNANLQNGANINISCYWCKKEKIFEILYKSTTSGTILPGTCMPAITSTHNSIIVQIYLW